MDETIENLYILQAKVSEISSVDIIVGLVANGGRGHSTIIHAYHSHPKWFVNLVLSCWISSFCKNKRCLSTQYLKQIFKVGVHKSLVSSFLLSASAEAER